jgi:helix-turn-helix protein
VDTRTLSIRAASREYGLARKTLNTAIASGELRARRLGARRVVILRAELERFLLGMPLRPSASVESIVARRLQRERERATTT